MKTAVALAAVASTAVSGMTLDADVHLFQQWKQTHNKQYQSEQHEMDKFNIFKSNAAYINEHNMLDKSYTLALNQYADMTNDEYRNMLLGSGPKPEVSEGSTYIPASNVNLPDEVDWRTKDLVTPMKNQGQCGSCWAFSTVASIEGQYAKKNGQLLSFSEQQLVDCAGSFGNNGCNGGLMDNAFSYIKSLTPHGLDLESSYPYTGRDGRCHFSGGSGEPTTPSAVSGFTDIKQFDEDDLTNALASVGPISVAIDASHRSFQFYNAGVYNEESCSSTQLDHGVTAVGYGTEGGEDYFLVKNSWGTTWGIDGYIKMSRGRSNQCGIATAASFPILK